MFVSTRVVYAVLFYVLLSILIILIKPSFIFNEEGNLKHFGTGQDDNKTIFSFGVFVLLLAIMSFYIFCMIDLIFSENI